MRLDKKDIKFSAKVFTITGTEAKGSCSKLTDTDKHHSKPHLPITLMVWCKCCIICGGVKYCYFTQR